MAFTYGRFGKPELAGLRDQGPIYFNASRSGALAVYAVTAAGPVGVDVERLRPVTELEYIAARFFPRDEADLLRTLPLDVQMEAFFACWTCKEALVKATGDGIARGPGSSRVDSAARLDGESRVPEGWRFQLLQPAAGYLATLAHRPGGARLRRWTLSGPALHGNGYGRVFFRDRDRSGAHGEAECGAEPRVRKTPIGPPSQLWMHQP